ncbi:MAG TPA: helix-turn-helix domain-containing protein [Gemmatimonadales bacterium]|nr:helix-turn-helix domain-containing protein [Gemmatimonadales bacterium]
MPKDGTETRLQILDAAQELILARGFAGTSVDDILARTGLTKGAFFHHFKSKHELARALVERHSARDLERFEAILERAERLHRDPVQQLLIFFGLYAEFLEELADPTAGCLFASYLYESQLFDDSVLEIIRSNFAHWRKRLGEKLRAAAELHPPRIPVDLDDVADMFNAVAEGAFVMARTEQDPKVVARQLRQMRNYVELLFGAA